MTIHNDDEWREVELKALAAEHDLEHIETPPVPEPTVAQQLAFVSVRCAELQAKLIRLQGHARTAWMWIGVGDPKRAQDELTRLIVEL